MRSRRDRGSVSRGTYGTIAKHCIATVIIDTGLRPEESFRLKWECVTFTAEPLPKCTDRVLAAIIVCDSMSSHRATHRGTSSRGYGGRIFNEHGKSKAAHRSVSMTRLVHGMLFERQKHGLKQKRNKNKSSQGGSKGKQPRNHFL
jgi:hypothetical protein